MIYNDRIKNWSVITVTYITIDSVRIARSTISTLVSTQFIYKFPRLYIIDRERLNVLGIGSDFNRASARNVFPNLEHPWTGADNDIRDKRFIMAGAVRIAATRVGTRVTAIFYITVRYHKSIKQKTAVPASDKFSCDSVEPPAANLICHVDRCCPFLLVTVPPCCSPTLFFFLRGRFHGAVTVGRAFLYAPRKNTSLALR